MTQKLVIIDRRKEAKKNNTSIAHKHFKIFKYFLPNFLLFIFNYNVNIINLLNIFLDNLLVSIMTIWCLFFHIKVLYFNEKYIYCYANFNLHRKVLI